MSGVGTVTLYTPGRYSHHAESVGASWPKHRGEQWRMADWGDELRLTHRDAVDGRLLQEWTTATSDDAASRVAERFSAALDSMPRSSMFNAWSERLPIYLSPDAVHVNPARGSYVGVRMNSPEARTAFDDALRAIDDFMALAHTDGPIRRPIFTPARVGAAAGIAVAAALVYAGRDDT